ncbi:MAG: hypothetical protein HQL70_09685 [Magnetococcales bacterium]|nr:hypothetical protein [Magnetococcales bacterium]
MTVQVKMRTTIAGPGVSGQAGQIIPVTKNMASALVASGSAEYIDGPPKAVAIPATPETAEAQPAPETAEAFKPQPKRAAKPKPAARKK